MYGDSWHMMYTSIRREKSIRRILQTAGRIFSQVKTAPTVGKLLPTSCLQSLKFKPLSAMWLKCLSMIPLWKHAGYIAYDLNLGGCAITLPHFQGSSCPLMA